METQLYTVYEKVWTDQRDWSKASEFSIVFAHHRVAESTVLFQAVELPRALDLLKRYTEARAAGETAAHALYLATKE